MKRAAGFIFVFVFAFFFAFPSVSAESAGEALLSETVSAKGGGDAELYGRAVIAAARSGILKSKQKNDYLDYIESETKGGYAEYTPYEIWRTVTAVNALGKKNVVNGFDLRQKLFDYGFAIGRTETSAYSKTDAIYSLLALDSYAAAIPETYDKNGAETPVTTSRLKLADVIIRAQNTDGSFGFFSYATPDFVSTAMAVIVLLPYGGNDDFVSEAINSALDFLSDKQSADGGYYYDGGKDCVAASAVIIALCAAGVDVSESEGFSKDKNLLEFLESMAVDGAYKAERNDSTSDAESTIAALSALNAVKRLKNGDKTFYDMSDKGDATAVLVSGIVVGIVLLLIAALLFFYQRKKRV